MQPTFFANSNRFRNLEAVRVAVLKLSMAGYLALEVRDRGDAMPSIRIDKPLEGVEIVEIVESQVAEKRYGSAIYCHCRVYWLMD